MSYRMTCGKSAEYRIIIIHCTMESVMRVVEHFHAAEACCTLAVHAAEANDKNSDYVQI